MSIKIGTNNVKDIYLGTSKVKEIFLGTNKVYSSNSVPVDPTKWVTLWSGEETMMDFDYYDGTYSVTVNGLNTSKPIQITADCYYMAWEPTTNLEEVDIIDEGIGKSLIINTSSGASNVPNVCEVDCNNMSAFTSITAETNKITADYIIFVICGGYTIGCIFWVLKSVAQYEG